MKKYLLQLIALLLLTGLLVSCGTPAANTNAPVEVEDAVNEPVAELEPADTPEPEPTEEEPVEEVEENPVEESEPADEKILVYISGPEAMINKLEEAFEEIHGDVLDMSIMSCGQLRTKVWTESQAGEIQADVFWGSNPLVYNLLDENGFLEPLEIENLDSIAEEYHVADKNYALVNERFITILYNTDMIGEGDLPASFADLADPKYADMIAIADANQSSTAFAMATVFYEMSGNNGDFFQGLKDNNIVLTKANGATASGVMEGQFAIGIAPYDPLVRLRNQGKQQDYEVPMGVVWPSDGAIALQRPIAIPVSETRTEGQEAIAQAFVNFMLSKQAQTITVKFGFVSVRTDIENPHLPTDAEIYYVDWEMGNENEEALKDVYQEIFH